MNSRTARIALPLVAIAVVVLGYAGYQYFIVADSPDEVTTEAALEQLIEDLEADDVSADDVTADDTTDEVAAAADEPTETAAPAPEGVFGTWTIDDEFGDFAFENASGSFAGFRVDKALFVGGGQTAVGRSGDVSGSIETADGAVVGGEVVVDMTTIQSDISQRESAIADAVKADEFGTATFVITDGGALDTAALEAGSTVSAPITGELTIAGVTNTVTISAEATVAEAGLALIVGSAELVWADYGVETPNSTAGTVADDGILEFQLIVRLG
ncbi:MAG: YceI family protein [Actinomycetota bacterium]